MLKFSQALLLPRSTFPEKKEPEYKPVRLVPSTASKAQEEEEAGKIKIKVMKPTKSVRIQSSDSFF